MERTEKIAEAWAWARRARLEISRKQREELASPGSPFKARPGQEETLEEADDALFALSFILEELEEAYAREREAERAEVTVRAMDMALVFGLALLATLGVAAACILASVPDPVVRASAVIGTAVSLGWAVKTVQK